MKELTVSATLENIETVTAFVDEQLEEMGCPLKAQMQINIAIDEIFSNIAQYAYTPDTGEATVRVDKSEHPTGAVITFTDRGKPYNPLAKEDPDTNLSVEGRTIGGLGIFVVKKIMDHMSYEHKDGGNILTIRKGF